MEKSNAPEPWLRGTLTEVPSVLRAVLHALELAEEDIERWCSNLSDEEFNMQPNGIPSVAFHLRHIARSIDRLLSYAEGRQLTVEQLEGMKQEQDPGATSKELFSELHATLLMAAARVRAFVPAQME